MILLAIFLYGCLDVWDVNGRLTVSNTFLRGVVCVALNNDLIIIFIPISSWFYYTVSYRLFGINSNWMSSQSQSPLGLTSEPCDTQPPIPRSIFSFSLKLMDVAPKYKFRGKWPCDMKRMTAQEDRSNKNTFRILSLSTFHASHQ